MAQLNPFISYIKRQVLSYSTPGIETELIGDPFCLNAQDTSWYEEMSGFVEYGVLNSRGWDRPVAALDPVLIHLEPRSSRSDPVQGPSGFTFLAMGGFSPASIERLRHGNVPFKDLSSPPEDHFSSQ